MEPKSSKRPEQSKKSEVSGMFLRISPSLQFCNQSTKLRNGSLEAMAGAGPMNLRSFHAASRIKWIPLRVPFGTKNNKEEQVVAS